MHVVGARVGDAGLVEPGDHLLGGQAGESLDDDPAQLVPRGVAPEVTGEALLGGKARLPQHHVAEDGPFPFVLKPQQHRLAIARREQAVGVDGGVAGSGAGRRRCAVVGVVERIVHPLDQRFQHRDVQVLAASGLLPLEQCRQDAGIGVHPGRDVGDRRPRLGRRVLGPRHRQEPGLPLDQQVIGLAVAVRPVIAVAGDVADDDPGLFSRQSFVRQAEAGRGARRQVLDHDIGLFGDQALQDGPGFRVLDVERQAFLGAVGPDEMGCQTIDPLVIAAGEVSDTGPFHLDDAGTQIGKLARGEGSGDGVFECDDRCSSQRFHVPVPYRMTAVASIVSQPSWSLAQRWKVFPSLGRQLPARHGPRRC